jgi:acyl-CoA thioester hydrolase
MFTYEHALRVRYVETDQMGFVYHGHYATYYEVGRVEMFRAFGFPYKELEEQGVMMPIFEQTVRFRQPSRYDDLLTIKSIIETLPDTRMIVKGEIYNPEGKLINNSLTTLVFVNIQTLKPIRCPSRLLEILQPYFG